MTTKPTTIITGFLGAGKTTFLNHVLRKRSRTKFAIIENEFGEQNIDSELIVRTDNDIVALSNGCLCCTLKDNLYDILNAFYERSNEYDEVLIEATGIANPARLAEPFLVQSHIKKHFPLTRIICLVDAELIEEQLENTEEAIGQITFSDLLLINKTDLVTKDYLKQLKVKLQGLNPLAEIVAGNQDDFPDFVWSMQHPVSSNLFAGPYQPDKADDFPVSKSSTYLDHDHTEDVVSYTYVFDRPFKFLTLHHQMTVFLAFQAADLYRMKGLLAFENSNHQYIMQSVGKNLTIDEKGLWRTGRERISTIVFIGRDLPKDALQKLLTRCLA